MAIENRDDNEMSLRLITLILTLSYLFKLVIIFEVGRGKTK